MTTTPDRADPRLALVSSRATVVRFDATAGRLCHGPIGGREVNVFATRHGHDVTLYFQDGEEAHALGFGPDHRFLVPAGEPAIIAAEAASGAAGDERIVLRAGGRMLIAEPDGAAWFSGSGDPDRDSFLLIGRDDLERIEFVCANRWFSRLTGDLVQPDPAASTGRHTIRLGAADMPIAGLIEAARPRVADAMPRELLLMFDTWRSARFLLYRPLAYFVAYGRDTIFQCAEIAIRSLFECGAWEGGVLLITDTAHIDFAARLPEPIRNRISVAALPANDVLDFTLARYRIGELTVADRYQPVLYLDTDVVCDSPVRTLLQVAAFTADLHAMPEFPLNSENDHYGQSLLKADGIGWDPAQRGFSSGVFAFRDIAEQRVLFRTIIETARRVTAAIGRRDSFECYDQAFFNYVLYKTRSASELLLRNAVELHLRSLPPLTARVGKGFVHFAGGVGVAAPKLEHMQAYFDVLRRARDQDMTRPALPRGA